MATPSLAMIPSAYADSKVYSVLPNNGDGDFTFNRDSSATRVGQNGLIQTVGFFGNELVVNGDFATDTNWNKNANWTISGGKANADGTSSADINQNTNLPTIGKTYLLTYTISNYTSGTFKVQFGGVLLAAKNAVGTYEETLTAVSTDRIRIKGTNPLGSISYISVKEITGDQPRLNYDISNGVVQSCPSLLLEGASTNLLPYSEDFSQSDWIKSNTTITSNSVISPDGSLNASTLTDNTANGIHRLRDSVSLSASTDYSLSVFAKKGTLSNIQLALINTADSSTSSRVFDLENGVLGESITTQTLSNSKITDYGNGWFKCEITAQLASTPNTYQITLATKSSGNATNVSQVTYDGDGTGNVYLFGAMLEESSYCTSYIPTNGSSQTRAAETCIDAGTAATFNSTEGVLYAELSGELSGTNRYITLSNSAISDRVNIFFDANNDLRAFVNGISSISGGVAIQGTNKCAFKYKSGDIAFWVNGIEVGTRTATLSLTGLSQVSFNLATGFNVFYGNCKDIRVYNEALTDAQLQTLTTL